RPGALAQQLPGNDVGVVLELGDQNFVAGLQISRAIGRGDQVDAIRGAACVHDFFTRAGVDECRDAVARGLVLLCSALRQGVNRAVHVGVGVAIIGVGGLDDRRRLLGRGGVV